MRPGEQVEPKVLRVGSGLGELSEFFITPHANIDFAVSCHVLHQGQLPLTRCSGKDFQQERFAPAAAASFHGDTVLAGMLF